MISAGLLAADAIEGTASATSAPDMSGTTSALGASVSTEMPSDLTTLLATVCRSSPVPLDCRGDGRDDDVDRVLLAFARVSEDDLLEFEAAGADVLVRFPGGSLAWACSSPREVAVDGLPWFTVRAAREAGGRVTAVVMPAVADTEDDDVANDYGDEVSFV